MEETTEVSAEITFMRHRDVSSERLQRVLLKLKVDRKKIEKIIVGRPTKVTLPWDPDTVRTLGQLGHYWR